MKLHRSGRGNRYCGPAVLSALTGIKTEVLALMIREVTGKPMVTGLRVTHLIELLDRWGWSYRRIDYPDRPTWKRWVESPDRPPVAIVSGARHYAVVSGDQGADTGVWMSREPGHVDTMKRPRTRIVTAIAIHEAPVPDLPEVKPPLSEPRSFTTILEHYGDARIRGDVQRLRQAAEEDGVSVAELCRMSPPGGGREVDQCAYAFDEVCGRYWGDWPEGTRRAARTIRLRAAACGFWPGKR